MTRKMLWVEDRRQDAVGTPFCITVDHDTLKKQFSNNSAQRHHAAATVDIKDLQKIIKQETDIRSWLIKAKQ